jgi:hypothetical protein
MQFENVSCQKSTRVSLGLFFFNKNIDTTTRTRWVSGGVRWFFGPRENDGCSTPIIIPGTDSAKLSIQGGGDNGHADLQRDSKAVREYVGLSFLKALSVFRVADIANRGVDRSSTPLSHRPSAKLPVRSYSVPEQ